MGTVSLLLAFVIIAATLLPFLRTPAWWVRVLEFPRLQLAALGVFILTLYLATSGVHTLFDAAVVAAVCLCIAYQGAATLPYTPVWKRQVQDASLPDGERTMRLLLANVQMTNRNAARFLQLISQHNPDLVLAVESDSWWLERLRTLGDRYPNGLFCPLENTYGMLLFSRLELIAPQVRYLVHSDVPSIYTRCRLRSGDEVELHFLHPRPPIPPESDESAPRDAELLIVAGEMKESSLPRVVAGDLNDVAWSRTTKLFQKISGLLDPRVGRGFFNTFPANHPVLRYSLDHVFHSREFRLRDFRILSRFGSDHLPVLISLSLEPEAAAQQKEPQATPEDIAEKHEIIREAPTEQSTASES